MHEGKNIHFSPADNKPLCSYSGKLCRQRRLNGYAFCIRHILEDTSSPFKQCAYRTKANSQKCLNAIPSHQNRGYCHSHMQVTGMIPKTERKVKTPKSETNGKSKSEAVSKKSSISSSSSSYDFAEDSSSSNSFSEKFKPNSQVKASDSKNENKWKEDSWKSITLKCATPESLKNPTPISNGKMAKTNGSLISKQPAKPKNTTNTSNIQKSPDSKFKPDTFVKATKTAPKIPVVSLNSNQNGKLHHSHVSLGAKENSGKSDKDEKPMSKTISAEDSNKCKVQTAPKYALLSTEQKRKFQQLRLMRFTKNLQTEVANDSPIVRTSFVLKTDDLEKKPNPPSISYLDSICCMTSMSRLKSKNGASNGVTETRQQFLARVRQAFKSEYQRLSQHCLVNATNDQRTNIPYQQTLAVCSYIDPELCAKALSDVPSICQNEISELANGNSNKKLVNSNSSAKVNGVTKAKSKDGVTSKKKPVAQKSNLAQEASLSVAKKSNNGSLPLIPKPDTGAIAKDGKGKKKNTTKSTTKNLKVQLVKIPDENIKSVPSSEIGSPVIPLITKASQMTQAPPKKPARVRNNNNNKPVAKVETSTSSPSSTMMTTNPVVTLTTTKSNNAKKKKRAEKPTLATSSTTINNGENSKKQKLDSTIESTPPLTFAQQTTTSFMDYNGESSSTTFVDTTGDSTTMGNNNSNSGSVSTSTPVTSSIEYDFDSHLSGGVMNELTTSELASSNTSRHASVADMNGILGTTPSLNQMLCQPPLNGGDLCGFGNHNIGLETVLNCVNSTDNSSTHDGVPESAFDSPFNHSVSSHPADCDFSDDDLAKLELSIDPEIAHQASRLLEDNELTEDDFNMLFPDSRAGGEQKMEKSDSLSNLGLDFNTNFDASDIDCALFTNILPNFSRPNQPESISISNQF